MTDQDFTVWATTDAVIIALVRRLQGVCQKPSGPVTFTAGELARASQMHLDRRADGHKLELRITGDT